MEWLQTSLWWYLMLFSLGIVFFPLTKKIMGRFSLDFGYPFSKTLSILLISYVIFVLGIIKLLPFTQLSLFILIFIFILVNYFIIKKEVTKDIKLRYQQYFIIIIEEVLFLASLLFWTYVRSQEPSIHGLEKFMDYGFIKSILRSKYFPPLDMWLSADSTHPEGYPINYYYFGHLTGAVLIKLIGVKAEVGYNLILSTIFALAVTQVFSFVINIIINYLTAVKNFILSEFNLFKIIFLGFLGTFIVNFGGNLHTVYLFTKGYSPDKPVPFWQILSGYNPTKYWYPNATRFIPFTIHEFPIYSYVVADLHGHVFDIPFVLLTLSVLFILFLKIENKNNKLSKNPNFKSQYLITLLLGFLMAVHYMTNAFDGPIYILLSLLVFLIIFGLTSSFLINIAILLVSFFIFSLPFSINFVPFAAKIGVNCSPDFLVNIGKFGPFLFEKGNCQVSPLWMLFILWGFFWVNFILFLIVKSLKKSQHNIDFFIFLLFSFGSFLIIIPEFFYIKDIYPAHFRANTMFKLGYQAFIMMGIASVITFFQIRFISNWRGLILKVIFIFFFFFISIYPLYAIPSYYGNLDRPVEMDGSKWLVTQYPEDKEIIDFFNKKVTGQPVILEAQGDSYTDYERISAYTGLPTVAGWWVHEWLWRGSPDVVGKKIPDIVNIYESDDINLTKNLIKQYHIKYIVVSKMEKTKYPRLKENKFSQIGKVIFKSTNNFGVIYQVN